MRLDYLYALLVVVDILLGLGAFLLTQEMWIEHDANTRIVVFRAGVVIGGLLFLGFYGAKLPDWTGWDTLGGWLLIAGLLALAYAMWVGIPEPTVNARDWLTFLGAGAGIAVVNALLVVIFSVRSQPEVKSKPKIKYDY